jgi:cell wall-associated NlpC family hydrolase
MRIRSRLAALAATTLLITGIGAGAAFAATAPVPAKPAAARPAAAAVTGQSIADLARAQVGNTCGPYHTAGGESACDNEWCAVFAGWVWRQAGVNPAPDEWVATEVGVWGEQHGQWKPGADNDPQPGDIVVFGAPGSGVGGHVGVVYSVNSNGTITTINGDYGSNPTHVVLDTINPNTALSGVDNVHISGYVSPPGVTVSTPPPTPRIGVLTKDGTLMVKEGGLAAKWNPTGDLFTAGDVKSFQISGNMIAVLSKENHLYVKQGALDAPWYDQTGAGNVQSYAIDYQYGRIGVILDDGNGTLWVKEGGIQGAWDKGEDNHDKQVALSGQWIGVVRDDGSAWVKNGTLAAGWGDKAETVDVADLELSYLPGRIGVIKTNGDVWVKDNGTAGNWDQGEDNNDAHLELSGDWIGVVENQTTNDNAKVKVGGLQQPWDGETNPVLNMSIDEASGYVAVLLDDGNGTVWVKDGGIQGTWDKGEANSAQDVQVTSYPST